MTERIVHSVAEPTSTESRRQRDSAMSYRPDPTLERLFRLGAKTEAGNVVAATELGALSPSMRMSLGYFSISRSAAIAEGLAQRDGELTDKAARR